MATCRRQTANSGTYCTGTLLVPLPIYSMEQSPWEANRFSASQKIPRTLYNPKVYYLIHKCPPLVHILSQINPVHAPLSHILHIHLNIILLSTPGSSKWSPILGFPHHNPIYTSLLPIRATCPAYLILLDLMNQMIFGEKHRPLTL